jgi:hypothetical protein
MRLEGVIASNASDKAIDNVVRGSGLRRFDRSGG